MDSGVDDVGEGDPVEFNVVLVGVVGEDDSDGLLGLIEPRVTYADQGVGGCGGKSGDKGGNLIVLVDGQDVIDAVSDFLDSSAEILPEEVVNIEVSHSEVGSPREDVVDEDG